MISYHSLKQMLLKAVSLGKNRQGLVYVQRIANGPTGTYLTHKWIRPDQVGATDKVLVGHVHLHSSHPQAPVNPKQYSSFSFPYSNAVKQQTAAFFSQMPNTQTFYQVLQNLGITYNAHPTKPGITLMRAKGAMNAAIHNGLDLSTLPPQVLGLNNPVTLPAQPAVAQSQQPAQQPAVAQPVTSPPVTPATPPQSAPAPTTITLPPRAKVASQASKDAATQFCNSFATRQDFYDALTKMGITWTQTSKPGPTFMWAKCFLAQHIESGFDVNAAWAAIQNGTPTPPAQVQQPAPPPVVPTPPPAPPVDKSLLEVPKDATPAQIELIKHINNMTDYKTIRKCAVMGMVPEDDVASDYITNTLLERLRDWVTGNNHQKKCPASVARQFIVDMAGIGEKVKSAAKLWSNNSEQIVDELGVTGCKKSLISSGLNRVFDSTDMAALITPHQFITPVGAPTSSGSVSVPQMLSSLTSSFSDYATDKQFSDKTRTGKTNLGYTGYSPDEYQQRYDPNKEGLVRFLQKVKQDNAGNAEVAAEVDRMIADYDEAMKIVGGNAQLLGQLIKKSSWGDKQSYSAWDFGRPSSSFTNYDPENLQFTMDGANAQADALLSGLQSKGYSTDQIVDALTNFYYNDDLRDFKVHDSSGQRVYIDLYSDLTDPNTGVNPLDAYDSNMSSGVLRLALMKLQEQTGISDADAKAKGWYKDAGEPELTRQWMKDAQHYAAYTEADAKKVRDLINGIFEGHSSNPSAAKTTILANALMAVKFNIAAANVADNARDNARGVQNANGTDYAGNFDFYSPDMMLRNTARNTNSNNEWGSATYTVQQLSDKVTSQLNSTPSYSADYIQQLTQYYMDKAVQQGMAPTIDNAHTVAREDDLSDMDLNAGLDPLLDSPLKDVVYKTAIAMLSHVPKMKQDPKFQDKLDKKLNYRPYDFSVSTQPRLKPPPKTVPQDLNAITDAQLKAARQKLFKAASMSVATESEQVSDEMRKDINQNRFDYKAGEKTPDGKTFSGPFHRTSAQSNRCVLYNSRFFAIHNSIWEERFKKKQAELKAAHPNNPDMWTPMDLFHGTARSCAGGILGRTAGWWMGKSTKYTAVAKMLGPGAYFGFKLGKSTVYVGDVAYTNVHYRWGTPPPGDADGIVIMANVMRGDNYVKHKTATGSFTSVSTDSQRDWEMAVRDNALIWPHHFFDASCRAYNKNVQVDANGNYLDDNGNITHDKYGKSVNMK